MSSTFSFGWFSVCFVSAKSGTRRWWRQMTGPSQRWEMEKWWLSFWLGSRKPKWDLFCSRVRRSSGETGSDGREKKLIQLDVARVHRSLGALLLLHLLTSTVTRPPMALAHYFPSDLDPRFVVSNYLISACLTSIKIFLFTTNISRFIASSCFVSPTKLKCFDMERVFRSFRQAA